MVPIVALAIWIAIDLAVCIASEEPNPLLENLLPYQKDAENRFCAVCLEDFQPDEIVFACHPIPNQLSKQAIDKSYSKMHILHIPCAINSIWRTSVGCPICKVPIESVSHLDERFAASIFQIGPLIERYGQLMCLELLRTMMLWMADAVEQASTIQRLMIDRILQTRPASAQTYTRIYSFLDTKFTPNEGENVQFKQLMGALKEELFPAVMVTERTIGRLREQAEFRLYLLGGMLESPTLRTKLQFWLSYCIMIHFQKGLMITELIMEEYHVNYIRYEPLFLEYLLTRKEEKFVLDLLQDTKGPRKLLLPRTIKFIFQRVQTVKLMGRYAKLLASCINDDEFERIFKMLNRTNYLDKCFILYQHAGSVSRQLMIAGGLGRIFAQFPHILGYYAAAAISPEILRGLSRRLLINRQSECLYSLIPFIKVDYITLAGILAHLISQNQFDYERLRDQLLATFSLFNCNLLVFPMQIAVQVKNRAAIENLGQFFLASHYVWLMVNPFQLPDLDLLRLRLRHSSDESSQMIMYLYARENLFRLDDYINMGAGFTSKYARLLLVQCELNGFREAAEYLRDQLEIEPCSLVPKELLDEKITCIGLEEIIWLTVRLRSFIAIEPTKATRLIEKIKDPFHLAAIMSIALERGYVDLFNAMIESLLPSDYDLLLVPFEYAVRAENCPIINSLMNKISLNSPVVLVAFFDCIENIPQHVYNVLIPRIVEVLDQDSWKVLYLLLLFHFQYHQLNCLGRLTQILELLPVEYLEMLCVYAEYSGISELRTFIGAFFPAQ